MTQNDANEGKNMQISAKFHQHDANLCNNKTFCASLVVDAAVRLYRGAGGEGQEEGEGGGCGALVRPPPPASPPPPHRRNTVASPTAHGRPPGGTTRGGEESPRGGVGSHGGGVQKNGKNQFLKFFFDVFGSFWALLGPFRSRFEVILGHFGFLCTFMKVCMTFERLFFVIVDRFERFWAIFGPVRPFLTIFRRNFVV